MTAVLIIMIACLVPLMALAGFYFGFKTAKDIYQNGDISPRTIPFSGVLAKAEQTVDRLTETDEERKARILWENVENFGTDVPQKEVK